MNLPDDTFLYAHKIGSPWTDPIGFTLEDFQSRFLYTQCLGASQTAKSYWLLHSNGRFQDCNILARNLLERIFNSRLAIKSSRHAVELLANELAAECEGWRKGINEFGDRVPENLNHVQCLNQELANFEKLLGGKAPNWSYYDRAKESGLAAYYRSAYFHLCSYTHATHTTPVEKSDYPCPATDYIALMAPIDTAVTLHRLSCPRADCELDEQYVLLAKNISSFCFD